MSNVVKVGLSLLLLICLLDMPYGYYQFVRAVAMICFAWLAYEVSKKEDKIEVIIYIGLALLFQPIIKISLGRTIWNAVDVIVAGWMFYSVWRENRNVKPTT